MIHEIERFNVMAASIVGEKLETTKFNDTANTNKATRKRRAKILMKRIALVNVFTGSNWLGSSDFIARILKDASQIDNGTIIASCISVSLLIYSSVFICMDFET